MITLERLHSLLRYDADTGVFTRVVSKGAAKHGRVAGSNSGQGHLRIKIDNKDYLAHRLAWFYVFGEWPVEQIDHINGVRDDNRLCNLRDINNKANQQNSLIARSSKSGFRGVHWQTSVNKFAARIYVDNKVIFLGHFICPKEAYTVYLSAKKRFHNGWHAT